MFHMEKRSRNMLTITIIIIIIIIPWLTFPLWLANSAVSRSNTIYYMKHFVQ